LFSIIPLFVILVGLLIAALCVKALYDAATRRHWQTTTGVVRESSIKTKQVGAFTVSTTGWSGSAPRIVYVYEVEGRPYTAKGHAMIREERGFLGRRRQHLSDFAEGAAVPVWYDPADPTRSTVAPPRFGCAPVFGILVGLVFAFIGWGFWQIAGMVPSVPPAQ
jgi:hypothetical protein